MNIYQLVVQQVTPTPFPPLVRESVAEIAEHASDTIDAFRTLGFGMGALFVITIALVIVFTSNSSSRKANATALDVLADSSHSKDKDIAELKAIYQEERRQNTENMGIIGEQMTRSNDLWEANNIQAGQRVQQQQRMVEGTAQIAADLKTIATIGSPSVQHIKTKVDEVLAIATRLDDRTAPWDEIVKVLTPLLIELGVLRQKAKEHSTQPIPVVEMPPSAPEVKPS